MVIRFNDHETATQKLLCFTLCAMLFFSPITVFVNVLIVYLFRVPFSLDSLLLYGTLLILTLVSLGLVLKRIKLNTIIFPFFMFLAFIVSSLIHPDTVKYSFTSWTDMVDNKAYWLFIYAMPAFLFIRRIWDYDRLFRYLIGFAIPALLCSLGTLYIYLSLDSQPGYMNFSYDLLLPTIILLFGYFTKRKLIYLIGGIVGSFVMFFCGARGPLLCLLISMVLYVLFMSEKQSSKIMVVLAVSFAAVIMFVFWDSIIQLLYGVADSIGVNSRILEKIADGTLTDDSGRSTVRTQLREQLNLFGHGLFGDRVITEGRYAHNIFLEILVEFGLIFGTLLSILLLLIILGGLLTKDKEKRLLFIVFFSSSFVKLMMSSSYLSKEPAFYCLLGVCLSCFLKDDVKPRDHCVRQRLISLKYRGS